MLYLHNEHIHSCYLVVHQMIERYALYEIDKLRDHFSLANGVPKGVKQRYNIVPTQSVPVVLKRDDSVAMELMQWGFVPQNARDTNSVFRYKTFVVRSEDIFKKTMWEKSIRTQRCLVPVNGFYVWTQTPEGKIPHFVQVVDQPLTALAGTYSSWTNNEGVTTGMVSIVTAPADHKSRQLADRLPVIARPDQYDTWLDPTVRDMASIYDIMRAPAHETLHAIRVGDNINSKKIDVAALIVGV